MGKNKKEKGKKERTRLRKSSQMDTSIANVCPLFCYSWLRPLSLVVSSLSAPASSHKACSHFILHNDALTNFLRMIYPRRNGTLCYSLSPCSVLSSRPSLAALLSLAKTVPGCGLGHLYSPQPSLSQVPLPHSSIQLNNLSVSWP